MLKDKKRRLKLILIPRGHLKSTFITIAGTIQRLAKNPNERILIVNAVWDTARQFLKEIKGKVETDLFKNTFGVWESPQWNMDEITVATRTKVFKEPSVATAGLEKSITGQHFDTIICDDLVAKENTTTAEQIQKVIQYFESLFPILEPGGEVIVIGTRWDDNDLYGHIMKKMGHLFDVVVKRLEVNGNFIFPEKFNNDVVATLKASMRPSFFSSQYYNDPIADEDQVFKPEHFRHWTLHKKEADSRGFKLLPDNLSKFTTVDLAVSEKHDADETAIVTCGWDADNNVYVLDVKHGRFGTNEKVDQIYLAFQQYAPYQVGIEKVSAQKFFIDLLRWVQLNGREALPIAEVDSGGKRKEDRIMMLEPLFRQGKIFLPQNCHALETQLLKFSFKGTKGHDDIIDALAYQLKLYSPAQRQDKPMSWAQKEIQKDPTRERDVNFYANAVMYDTEDYNRQKRERQNLDDPLDWVEDYVHTDW